MYARKKITSHVFLSLIDDKSVTFVRFLGFGTGLILDDADSFDGTKSAKLTLQVVFLDFIAQTTNKEGFGCIALDLGIVTRLVLGEILLLEIKLSLLLFQPLTIAFLQP